MKKAKIFWRSILNKLREGGGKKVFASILFFRKNDEVRENCGINFNMLREIGGEIETIAKRNWR